VIWARLRVLNPWYKFKGVRSSSDIFYRTWWITKNKSLEVQISLFKPSVLFEVEVDTQWIGVDHGGLGFMLHVLWFFFNIKIYDGRHWNYEHARWYTDEDYAEEAVDNQPKMA